LGDFNCTEIDWQVGATCHPHNQSTVEFVQTIEDCFYTQHVLSPTRGSSILDIALSRDPELVSNDNVLHSLDNSDHNTISFTVHSRGDYGIISKMVRDFKRGKFDQINNVLSSIDWDTFLTGTAERCCGRFTDLLLQMVDKYIPLKAVSKGKTVGKPIWMTYKAKNC